ncbi:MAG: nuclear transport factor 2 family protein, partial [Saprospiraceae bacterium]
MKLRIIIGMVLIATTIAAQTPSKPANPFKKTPTPAPTSKPTTPAPIPSPTSPSTQSPPVPTPTTIPTSPTQLPSKSSPVITTPTSPVIKTSIPPITGTDQEQIITTVMRVFDAMKIGDSSSLRPLFSPACVLYTADANAAGQNVLTQESISAFIQSVGTPRKEVIDERILKYKIDMDGPLAQVWADYNLYVDNKFYHCGVDVFQLYKSPIGWKIFELADTRRKTGCGTDPKDDVSMFLDKWHADAAAANADAYFGAMASDGVFLGTDATERWSRDEFRAWAKPQFDSRRAWNFKPSKRNITLINDNTTAWFDEELTTWMGTCRGSGVLIKTGEGWKIKQYNLTILVPNGKLQDYLNVIGMK